jgi:hypothetical protein
MVADVHAVDVGERPPLASSDDLQG